MPYSLYFVDKNNNNKQKIILAVIIEKESLRIANFEKITLKWKILPGMK